MAKELKVIDIRDSQGKNQGTIEVDISSLESEKSKKVVSDVLLMYLSNKKKRTASTKTRSEIDMTNKKPWKQKGTGRARSGSARSPIWVGGGVAQGPRPRDVYFEIPRTLRKKALKDALLLKIKDGSVTVIDELKVEKVKTREMALLLKSFGFEKSVLVITDGVDKNLVLSVRNIPKVAAMTVEDLNPLDVVKAEKLLFTKDAFEKISKKIAA